jgi:hypothetical protein
MAITTRQTSTLVAEDWKKIYQTFREADFQSYDFQTLRKSMIDYLKIYYPEDFNDFVESSEYIALIDLIAFLGQSLAFRADLNARENFIDTAERRDSILKLARLINYVPKRNMPATGFLKIESVSTTEKVFDSNGINLNNVVVNWNDSANNNWLEQLITVLNAAMINTQVVGRPANSQIINNIQNDEYQINLPTGTTPLFKFTNSIENKSMGFELVSPSSKNQYYVYEEEPRNNKFFNLLYKNDNYGNNSNNTGFFLYFKQGELRSQEINITESIPNRVININENNINNNDIWLYSIDANGNLDTLWEQVPAISGTNIIYNKSSLKNMYQVNTRDNDQIDLVFGDGSFANIPQGRFKLFYRVSNGLDYKITPTELRGVLVSIPYVSKSNKQETLTLRASLYYTVANAAETESIEEIREKAPQQYYIQNRMVSGEDYNILPYTAFNSILKVKAVNRTSSGVSRYLDVIDPSGKYSSTNIFGQDGCLYKNTFIRELVLQFLTTNDIYKFVYNQIRPILSSKEMQHFYYSSFARRLPDTSVSPATLAWHKSTTASNGTTGYFVDASAPTVPVLITNTTTFENISYCVPGAILKLSAGVGKYFDAQNTIKTGTPTQSDDKYYLYATIMSVTSNGNGDLTSGAGSITISNTIPDGAIIESIVPRFNNDMSATLLTTIISNIQNYKNFGLLYDSTTQAWTSVVADNLSSGDFSENTPLSNWLIRFDVVNSEYKISYRGLEYVFESIKETRFYYDEKIKTFDPTSSFVIKDQIKVLKTNPQPNTPTPLGLDYVWHVYKNIIESDGYQNKNKILITFADENDDGFPDDPDQFEAIVDPDTNANKKIVFFEKSTDSWNFISYVPIASDVINTDYSTYASIAAASTLYDAGQVFYATSTGVFYQLDDPALQEFTTLTDEYIAKVGRKNLYFQYRHNSPNYRRIDPSPSNLIDLFILTKAYESDYREWIQDSTNSIVEPDKPNSEELRLQYATLENYKSISDTLVYNPAKFKPIFGAKADPALRATFKVIKNVNANVSDNDIKTSVISAINEYFNINNWDFGETFYFSELGAYLHSVLVPNIASIIIVPTDSSNGSQFGNLFQINAEHDEIIISAATVDNVEIISDITASQLK